MQLRVTLKPLQGLRMPCYADIAGFATSSTTPKYVAPNLHDRIVAFDIYNSQVLQYEAVRVTGRSITAMYIPLSSYDKPPRGLEVLELERWCNNRGFLPKKNYGTAIHFMPATKGVLDFIRENGAEEPTGNKLFQNNDGKSDAEN